VKLGCALLPSKLKSTLHGRNCQNVQSVELQKAFLEQIALERNRAPHFLVGQASSRRQNSVSWSATNWQVNSGSGFWRMLVANHGDKRQFSYASERLRCNIRTAVVVAKIFGEYFFASVCSH